jgi:uncharacterized protein (TIGR00369 family)
MSDVSEAAPRHTLDSLQAAGWEPFEKTGFIGLIGPLLFKTENGKTTYGFLADEKHENRRGVIHGGMLAAFCDRALGAAARSTKEGLSVATIELGIHYVSAANVGELIEADCEVVRMTRSLAFMRGTLRAGDRVVATAEGLWKILTPKDAA